MAAKSKKNAQQQSQKTPAPLTDIPPVEPVRMPIYLSFRIQAIVLAVIAFVFYCNTFSHEAAFDDMMAIMDNEYVQQGTSGIPDILTRDAYESYLEQKNNTNQLAGGRYRPLSLITFAIEQQMMGTAHEGETVRAKEKRVNEQMPVRHVVNVLLYMLSVVVLLYFFRYVVFKDNPVPAFIAALIFTVHPLHTEVVANVKSRDEILSVLFICLTFIQAFRYKENKQTKNIILALVYFFLALLSKEYAVTLILLLPLSFYIFNKESLAHSLRSSLLYLVPLGLYFLMRLSAVSSMAEGAENNVMNNPYLYATPLEKLATEWWVLLKYIALFFWPHPLISDYSYRQIPFVTFSDPLVWLSVLIYAGLIFLMIVDFRKRHLMSFAIAFFLFNILLVSNLFFNIGAPMGERLEYHSSIGLVIILGWMLYRAWGKIRDRKVATAVLGVLLLAMTVCSGYETIARNRDWKNDETLFLVDVKKAPNSVLENNNAAAACMELAKRDSLTTERNAWFAQAIGYFNKAIEIYPQYYDAYLNRGLSYYDMGSQARGISDWDTVRKYIPQQPVMLRYTSIAAGYFINKGIGYTQHGDMDSALYAFNVATAANPLNYDAWLLLGRTYLMKQNYTAAKDALTKATLSPKRAAEANGLLQQIPK